MPRVVYVLLWEYEYEGQALIGVFDSLDDAKTAGAAAVYSGAAVEWLAHADDEGAWGKLSNGGSASLEIAACELGVSCA